MKRRTFLGALLSLPFLANFRPAAAKPELNFVTWEEPGIVMYNPAAVSKLSMGWSVDEGLGHT